MQRCPLLRVVIDLCLGAQEGAVRLSGAGKKKSLLCDSFLLSPSQSLFLSFVNSVQCHGPRHAAEDKHVISVCMLRLTMSKFKIILHQMKGNLFGKFPILGILLWP